MILALLTQDAFVNPHYRNLHHQLPPNRCHCLFRQLCHGSLFRYLRRHRSTHLGVLLGALPSNFGVGSEYWGGEKMKIK